MINNAVHVDGNEYYSISLATIDSGNSDIMSVVMYGSNAGYGATVICRDSAEYIYIDWNVKYQDMMN